MPKKIASKGKPNFIAKRKVPAAKAKLITKQKSVITKKLKPAEKIAKKHSEVTGLKALNQKAKGVSKPASKLSQDKLKSIVDPQVFNRATCHVYDDGSKIYHSSLMWTDLKNNNNKYYIIQILQDDFNANSFRVYNRWGRVGAAGQFAFFSCETAAIAIATYMKKYKEKTGKGYTEIQMAFEDDAAGEEKPKVETKKKKGDKKGETKSKLDPRVQKLVNLIFDMKLMSNVMQNRGFDTKKMPLGKLSKSTLKAGHDVLLKIEEVLDGKKKGDLSALSGEFYTLIPHDFGFKHMSQFVINTKDKLKEKMETLESLGDLEFTQSLLNKGGSEVDHNYTKLNANIEPLEKGSEEYKIIEKYFENTKDNNKIALEEVYKITRKGEEKTFKEKLGNSFLLWHGSPITNMVSILSGGLKVRCKELPWLSDRIFHADMIAKSIGYTGYYASF